MRAVFICFCYLIVTCNLAGAQIYENIYRPADPQWLQLKTPHFNILFQQGEDSTAIYTGRILESQYQKVQQLVGGELQNMPVVLNGYNDRSNGLVTPFHFRIEVEVPSIKGKVLNPADGGWLETVMPHELAHALHLSVNPPWGISSAVNYFSPDLARSLHMMAPLGMLEGVAVVHESNVRAELSGRGNYPYFVNRYNANLLGEQSWSLGEMHNPSIRTRPFNRHYVGGHQFTNWLIREYGEDVMKENINITARWPFFGFGYTLRRTTSKWPSELYREFHEAQAIGEENRISTIEELGSAQYTVLDTYYQGPEINRPLWISEDEIIYYGTFYNQRPGFWRYNLQTGEQQRVYETRIVGDFWYDLSTNKRSLLYSRFHSHPYYFNTWLMDVHELDIEDSRSTRLTRHARMHAPVYNGDSIWALQTHHETSKWVNLDENGEIIPILNLRPDNIVEIRPNPKTNDIALVANRNGVQALWLITSEDSVLANPAVHLPNASIFDVIWHPEGNRLLFSADYGSVMNLFEWNVKENRVKQVTNSLYNAYEGSYSPDGSAIAYVSQEGDYRRLAVMKRADFFDLDIPDSIWNSTEVESLYRPRLGNELQNESDDWVVESYTTGLSWLRPRTFFPYYETTSQLGHHLGFGMASGDVLRRHSYLGFVGTSNNRFWYDAAYRYSGFFPGFRVNVYNQPIPVSTGLFEERGVGLRIPINITTESNTRFSGFNVSPGLRAFEYRVINRQGEALSEWRNTIVASLNTSYSHRVQQNIRDAQPNTGMILFAQNEMRRNPLNQWDHGVRGGLYHYSAPLIQFNQSLRLGAEVLVQNARGLSTAGFYSEGFSENVLAGLNNAYSLSARYTVPLWSPDRAGLLIPVQIERFYAVTFMNTVGPLTDDLTLGKYINQSRSVFGLGLRMGFGLFNARFDIGFAIGYEPTRDLLNPFVGIF